MEKQEHMTNQVLTDSAGTQWKIIAEHIWTVEAPPSDLGGTNMESRYLALIDTMQARMQVQEDRRYCSQKQFFDGIVGVKLSASHLKLIAPGDEIDLFTKLRDVGITTDVEFKHYSMSNPNPSLIGARRRRIHGWYYFKGHQQEEIYEEMNINGPTFGVVQNSAKKTTLGKPMMLLMPTQADQQEQESTVDGSIKPNVTHAVMIIGFGECELVGEASDHSKHPYWVVQNNGGSERNGRASCDCFSHVISPALVNYA